MQPLLQSLRRQKIRFQIIRRYSSVLRCPKAPFGISVQIYGFLEVSSLLLSYFCLCWTGGCFQNLRYLRAAPLPWVFIPLAHRTAAIVGAWWAGLTPVEDGGEDRPLQIIFVDWFWRNIFMLRFVPAPNGRVVYIWLMCLAIRVGFVFVYLKS